MGEEGRGFIRVQNQMGEAKPLNPLNIATWLISTCSNPCPFCLCLGDRALAPCILSLYMYMQRQRQETNRQAMEGKKMQRACERGIKQISMIDMASKETRKQANKSEGKQARKQTKGGVHEGPMWVWIEFL